MMMHSGHFAIQMQMQTVANIDYTPINKTTWVCLNVV